MAGSTNPLVADRVDTTSPSAGAGVLEDGYDLVVAIECLGGSIDDAIVGISEGLRRFVHMNVVLVGGSDGH
jgi:hypothetical protein